MGDGIRRPQPDLSFDDLYKQAESSVPVLEKSAQDFLNRLKVRNPELFKNVTFEVGPLKEPDRALAKVNTDYKGDTRQIKDIVRGRFIVDTPEQITAIKQAILEELDVDSMKDKFVHPVTTTGYRDINTKIGLENGHIAEIQIQQRDMLRVNTFTHDLMEEAQTLERKAKIENRQNTHEEKLKIRDLEHQMQELHAAAAHDGNLNTLVKAELREQFAYKGELDAKGSALGKLSETTGKLGRNGGVVAGIALGTLSSAFALASGSSKAEAAEIFYETAVPYGETELDLARGDLDAAARSATIETASNGGSFAGAAAGAAAGAMIGSAVPGLGTAAGAIVGGIIGGLGGGIGTGYITEKLYDNYAQLKSGAVNLAQETAESLSSAVQDTRRYLASWFDDDPVLDVQVAFASLPDRVTPDMPPEVAALVEVKASQMLFKQRFAEIEEHDGLPEVLAYIEAHPLEVEQKMPAAEERPAHYTHLPAPGLG
ncbi:RelA/SpoT domain-containing protein [Nitrosomonas marina]|uniref:RelA/SpoT domain-containing protein n=1 Tax=Nitrosomonas marina TaxID=917 RepID=A0A1H8G4S1_9PROT|nr:RelA/SpoT domain-containing protein [Nitrosomonas marina]SEN38879.1 hypothetical protein SAMN05216325_11631 [Nitrosomonas marina]